MDFDCGGRVRFFFFFLLPFIVEDLDIHSHFNTNWPLRLDGSCAEHICRGGKMDVALQWQEQKHIYQTHEQLPDVNVVLSGNADVVQFGTIVSSDQIHQQIR